MKKNLKWIILGIVVIIAIIIGIIVIVNEVQFNYKVEGISEYNYFVFIQENQYGVVDKNGNVVIEPNYVAVQIPNPSKPIFICVNSYNQETNQYDTIVYNEKKEELLSNYESIQAISIDTDIDSNPYEKSVVKYRQDGKYGLINLEGKEITDAIYDDISSVNYKEGTFTVRQDEKTGVINMNGKVIIPCEYETITSDNYYNEADNNKTTGFIVSKRTEQGYRYGYINYRGRIILDTEYTELERVTEIQNEDEIYLIAFQNGQAGLLKNKDIILNFEYEDIQYSALNDFFIVQRNGKQGVVNKTGEIILNTEYDSILYGGIYLNAIKDNQTLIFDLQGNQIETENISVTPTNNPNYYIAINQDDIYTVIDAEGNVLINNNYAYIEYITGDYFIVAKNGKNGIIDSTGRNIVDLKYTSIFRLNDTNLLQAEITQTNTIELYNLQIQQVASMDEAIVREYNVSNNNEQKYIMLASNTDFAYYDVNGNLLQAKDILTNNLLFARKIDDKWGFVDNNGNIKVQNEYEMVTDFNEYGFAGIRKDGKWGVINQEGIVIQEPIYILDWIQPTFLGKYYQINAWYGDARYSNDILEEVNNE